VDLPASLPSKLVEQRPDLKAGGENLHSASAQIGVAIAARIPQINASANVANSASTLQYFTPHQLLDPRGRISGPIFDGFTLITSNAPPKPHSIRPARSIKPP